MVLNVVEMGLGWRLKWFSRPFQRTGMNVEDYHAQFCDWKEEMVSLSFPAEEEDYIDGFIGNLRLDVRSRVLSKCLLSMSRLTYAFYAAKWEESMMFIDETLKKIKANMVFDEMPKSYSASKDFDDGVEYEKNAENGAYKDFMSSSVDIPCVLSYVADAIESGSTKFSPNTEFEEATMLTQVVSDQNVSDSEAYNVLDEMSKPIWTGTKAARHMFDEMPRPFLVGQNAGNTGYIDKGSVGLPLIDLQSVFGSMGDTTVSDLSMGSTKARVGEVTSNLEMLLDKNVVEEDAYKVFDKMSKLTSMEQNDNIVGLEDLILPIVELPRVLIYGSEVTEVNSFNSSSKLQFEEVCMFVTIKNRWMNAAFWIDGILMFIFDPGGCSLPQMGSDPFEFNGEKGEFRFTTIGVDTLVKAITHKCLILNASVGRDVVLYPYKLDEEDVYYNEVAWYNLDIVKSMLIIHDLCIQRYHRMYMPDDKMQACTAIFGLHKCDVNGSLLVLIVANSIPPWVALHNIDVVKPITPSVTGSQVLQQLMFPMKVYGILVLLKGEDSARHMVVGVVLIQVKNGKYLWSKGRNMKANHAIHLYLCSSSTASCMDPIAELIATMLTSSFTRTGMVFPHLGECKKVLSLINNDLMFLISLSRSSLLRAWDWNDLFYHGWGDIFKLISRAFFSVFEHLVSIGVIDVDLQTYVWEPGQYMIPYILEDKDVLKRKGIGIRLALKQDEELNGILTEIDLEIDLSFKEEFYIPAIVVPIGWFLDSKGKNLGELSVSPLKKSSVCLLKQNVVELIQKFRELFIIDLDHLPTSVKECNQTTLAGLEPLLQMVSIDVSKDTEDALKDNDAMMDTFVWDPGLVWAFQLVPIGEIEVYFQTFDWDPGLVWVFQFSTLRTRWLLRGRICHDIDFYYIFYMYFQIYVFGGL